MKEMKSLIGLLIMSILLMRARGFSSCFNAASKRTAMVLNIHGHSSKFCFSLTATSSSLSSQVNDASTKAVPKRFRPFPFEYHQTLTLLVESVTNLGVGVCRIDLPNKAEDMKPQEHSGETSKIETVQNYAVDDDSSPESLKWVIFVPGTIPGETVVARVFRNHKSYSDADLVRIVSPSKLHERVEPVCPLAGECGGCQYQHVSIDDQRIWKSQQVQELLHKIAKFEKESFPSVLPTVGTEHEYGYRSKLTPHYDRPDKKTGEIMAIGFQRKSVRKLIDVPQCAIATPTINERFKEVREEVYSGEYRPNKKNKGATLLFREANEGVITDPNQYVTTKVGELNFRFLAGNFFQNNPYMLPVMVEYVLEAALKHSRGGKKMTHLIDCYCGSGLFCLSAAKSFAICAGIEINEKAIEEATANAELNSIKNCAFVAAKAEAIFESQERIKLKDEEEEGILVSEFPRKSTVVILDPPRKGCSEEFLDQLYKYQPQRIVYMSCDPATQARDASGIVSNGYELTSTQPFDLFPQTRHIECLCVFEKVE